MPSRSCSNRSSAWSRRGSSARRIPRTAAIQILSATHGYVLLAIGGFAEEEMQRARTRLAVDLMVGLGADREGAGRALMRAIESRGADAAVADASS